MTDQASRYVGRLPTGEVVLVLPPEATRVLLKTHREMVADAPRVHRTQVEDMEGDIFDRLDLEMGNDTVAAGAVDQIEAVSEIMAVQLAKSLETNEKVMIRLSSDVCSNLLFWVNNLYTYSRRDVIDAATVGEAQDFKNDLDGDEITMSEESRLLMNLAEELVLAWSVF